MAGPKAPKDPKKKRSGFYIMRNKQISGSAQPNGTGVQFIYLNDGRMISSARIVGNITDDTMLEMLSTTEGFRRLVHSIGVSVEMDGADKKVEFVFQMYGKSDLYQSGTTLCMKVPTDGMEFFWICQPVTGRMMITFQGRFALCLTSHKETATQHRR